MVDEPLVDVLHRQHGVITRQQALELKLSPRQIEHRASSGMWIRVGRGVYRHAAVVPAWHGNLLAAVFDLGGLASHRASACLHRIAGYRPGILEVVVAHGRWRDHPGCRVRQSKQMDLADEVVIDGIPCTGLARTVLDLAAVIGPRRLEATIDAVIRDRRLQLADLYDVLVRHSRKGRDGCGRLRAALDERLGKGAVPLSDWSRMVARLLVDHGLPEPTLEHRIHDDGGRFVAQVDLAYPSGRVAVELDSIGFHLNRESFVNDRRRWNQVTLAGWTALSFTWADYVDDPTGLCRTVRAALLRS